MFRIRQVIRHRGFPWLYKACEYRYKPVSYTHLDVYKRQAGESLVQLQVADDVAQGGGGQVLNGAHGVLHAVGIQLGIGDLEVCLLYTSRCV